jgi:hypothetical protein
LEKPKHYPDENQSAEGECAPGSIVSVPYGIYIAGQRFAVCIARGRRVRQHPPNLSRVPQHRLVLRESEEIEGEHMVIDRETNVAPLQFSARIAGSQ